MNKLLCSWPTAQEPEYQCLRYINHTKSCPTYWHHINLLTSPFFYGNTHSPSRSIIAQILVHFFTRIFRVVLLVLSFESNCLQTAAAPQATRLFCHGGNPRRSAPIRGLPLGVDCPMSYINPRVTMTIRLLMTFVQQGANVRKTPNYLLGTPQY